MKRPFDHYWWAELNLGQEPVFLEVSVFELFPSADGCVGSRGASETHSLCRVGTHCSTHQYKLSVNFFY